MNKHNKITIIIFIAIAIIFAAMIAHAQEYGDPLWWEIDYGATVDSAWSADTTTTINDSTYQGFITYYTRIPDRWEIRVDSCLKQVRLPDLIDTLMGLTVYADGLSLHWERLPCTTYTPKLPLFLTVEEINKLKILVHGLLMR